MVKKIESKLLKNIPNVLNTKIEKNTNIKNLAKKPDLLKKNRILDNTKMKRKIQLTQKKLQIDEENLTNIIDALKTADIVKEKNKKSLFENLYLFVFLENQNEKLQDFDKEKFSSLKSKLMKHSIKQINNSNNLKICLVDDNLLNIKQKEKEADSYEKIIDKINLNVIEENNIDVISSEEFLSDLKSNTFILSKKYHNILLSEKLKTKVSQILKSKGREIILLSLIYYNKEKFGKKIFEYLQNLIKMSNYCSVLNIRPKLNLGMIKIGNLSLKNEDLLNNTKSLLIKTTSLLLTDCEKHTSVKCAIVKSESSLPFEIYKTMTSDDLEFFENF